MLTSAEQFPRCMAEKAFKSTCGRSPVNKDDQAAVKKLGTDFVADDYNLKLLFAKSAVACNDLDVKYSEEKE